MEQTPPSDAIGGNKWPRIGPETINGQFTAIHTIYGDAVPSLALNPYKRVGRLGFFTEKQFHTCYQYPSMSGSVEVWTTCPEHERRGPSFGALTDKTRPLFRFDKAV